MYDSVLNYFGEINKIARPSWQEDKMREWLQKFADERWLKYRSDDVWNLVVYADATSWYENLPTLTIQWHMDMVAVSSPDSDHDFSKDPIQTYEEDGWLHAKDTTLGADNGIAMAMMLAVLDLPHPPLELFFTVDEERWLVWALNFDPSMLSWSFLLNLDTEDEWEICISSAGGARVDIERNIEREDVLYETYELEIRWWRWWHSWVDIHKNRANIIYEAIKMLSEYDSNFQLCSINGGQADNAIPAEVKIVLWIEDLEEFQEYLNSFIWHIKSSYDEPDLMFFIDKVDEDVKWIVWDKDILKWLSDLPIGIQSMHPSIDGLVQTSINLGVIKTQNDKLEVTYAPRSSDNDAMDKLLADLETKTAVWQADMQVRSKYPGWSQNPDDAFVKFVKEKYSEVMDDHGIKILAYHAGLECGAIVAKLKQSVQAVSIGPNIRNPHSVHEKVELSSVKKLCDVVQKIVEEFADLLW